MSVTKQSLANRLNNFLGSQSLQRLITGKTTIDLNKAINQKKMIIFNLAKGKLGSKTSKIYGRFVLTTLLNIMLARADIPEEFRTPCHLYIDEFHNYISDSIQEAFAEGRKYKVYLTVATQVIGQGMSDEMKRSIMGNVNVKIIGKAGYESRDIMLKQMGFNREEEKILKFYHNLKLRPFRKKPLTVRAFKKMKIGQFIIQVDNHYPYMVRNGKKLLGNNYSMTDKEWEQFIAKQLEKYYAKPFIYSEMHQPIPNKTESEYNPFKNQSKQQSLRKEKNKLRDKNQLEGKRSFRNNIVE